MLTHHFPPFAPGEGDEYRALAAEHFDGAIEVGDDLHRVVISPLTGRMTCGHLLDAAAGDRSAIIGLGLARTRPASP